MSNYSQTTFFTPKDSLPPTNPAKTIFGAAYDVEFGNIATAITSKADAVSTISSITGTANQIGVVNVAGAVTLGLQQNVIIPTPTTGVALTANGASTGIVFHAVSQGATGVPIVADTNTFTNPQNIQIAASGTTAGTYGIGLDSSVNLIIGRTDVAHTALTISLAGNVTVSAPTSGISLLVSGPNGNHAAVFGGASSAGNSFGLLVAAGTNASDAALEVNNQANTQSYFQILGNGGISIGTPTGGNQGLGTVNATGLFVNGGQLFFGVPTSASTVAAVTDVGKMINTSINLAVNTGVFSQGHILSVYNNSASALTINGTIATMRLAGTATTGNRTLAPRGIATLWFESGNEVIVSGPGVS